MKTAGAEQSNQSNNDQINGDDKIQQPGYDQNKNSGDQRYQGSKSQSHIHRIVL
jgi:hypothetical protein